MASKWKQFWCRHWWCPPATVTVPYGAGPIICFEQRQFERTSEVRKCYRCDLVDTRVVKVECLGWS